MGGGRPDCEDENTNFLGLPGGFFLVLSLRLSERW